MGEKYRGQQPWFCLSCRRNFDIKSQQDGISASSWLQAEDGTYTILTGEGSASVQNQNDGDRKSMEQTAQEETDEDTTSIKGMKAATQMVLKGGTYTIDAEDDTFHSNGNLAIHGGTYTLSSGDDGIHADSNVTISGGTIDVAKKLRRNRRAEYRCYRR